MSGRNGTPNITVRAKGPNKWEVCADWGREGGRRLRSYGTVEGPTSEADATRAAYKWARTAKRPETIRSILDAYIDAKHDDGAADQTVRLYRGFARMAAGQLPDVPPDELTTRQVSETLHAMLDHGGQGGRRLTRSTVSRIYWFLCGAFDWARDVLGAVEYNAIRPADHPQQDASKAKPLIPSDLSILSAWCAATLEGEPQSGTDRNVALSALIAMHAGLRVGEVCALRWRDVDWARNALDVNGTVIEPGGPAVRQNKTKTTSSTRNVTMDATLRAALESEHDRVSPSPDRTVITPTRGGWVRPCTLSGQFRARTRALGLSDGVSFHSLRHTFATYQIRAGVPIKTVAARLGHKRIETTLSIYGHVLAGDDAIAAGKLEAAYAEAQTGANMGGPWAAGRIQQQADAPRRTEVIIRKEGV